MITGKLSVFAQSLRVMCTQYHCGLIKQYGKHRWVQDVLHILQRVGLEGVFETIAGVHVGEVHVQT